MLRRSICLLFIVCLFSAAILRPVWCEDIKNRWGIGYRYGFVSADDDDFKTHGNAHNLNLTYGLMSNLALECEAGYFSLKSKAGSKIGVYSFHTSLSLRKDFKDLSPYLRGGIGFQAYDYSNVRNGDRKDSNFSYSYESGAGLEYFLNRNWALNLEAIYIYGNTGGDATLDVYSWQYGGGIKYYF